MEVLISFLVARLKISLDLLKEINTMKEKSNELNCFPTLLELPTRTDHCQRQSIIREFKKLHRLQHRKRLIKKELCAILNVL